MNGLMMRVVPVVLVAVLLAAAVALTTLKHPVTLTAGTSPPLRGSIPVGAVTRACAAPGLAGGPAAQVALVSLPGGSAGSGKAVVSRFGAVSGAPLATLSQPGALAVTAVKPAAARGGVAAAPTPAPSGQPVATVPAPGGVIIQATGSMAQGLEAEQVAAAGSAVTRCDGTGTDFWFVGPGRFTVKHVDLYLMNPTTQAADVSVEAFTDAGPLQGSPDTGVAVPAGTMVVQNLDAMLQGTRVVALHVRTSVGQVTAAVHESTRATGGSWLPGSQAPATRIVLPGLPATAGARQLFVTVPGTTGAHLTITAFTNRGSYQPTVGGGLDIPGGSAFLIPLPSLANVPGSLEIAANVPVTASVMVPGGQRGSPGVFTTAYPPVEAQGVVAQNLAGHGTTAELVLSAPSGAARARIADISAGAAARSPASGAGQVVQIAAKHSLVVPLGRPAGSPKGAPFAVVITPLAGSGPLYAGRVLAFRGHGGTVQSILPVPAAPASLRLPAVRNAPITARS